MIKKIRSLKIKVLKILLVGLVSSYTLPTFAARSAYLNLPGEVLADWLTKVSNGQSVTGSFSRSNFSAYQAAVSGPIFLRESWSTTSILSILVRNSLDSTLFVRVFEAYMTLRFSDISVPVICKVAFMSEETPQSSLEMDSSSSLWLYQCRAPSHIAFSPEIRRTVASLRTAMLPSEDLVRNP